MNNQYEKCKHDIKKINKTKQGYIKYIYIYLIGRISNSLEGVNTKSNSYFESESPGMKKRDFSYSSILKKNPFYIPGFFRNF